MKYTSVSDIRDQKWPSMKFTSLIALFSIIFLTVDSQTLVGQDTTDQIKPGDEQNLSLKSIVEKSRIAANSGDPQRSLSIISDALKSGPPQANALSNAIANLLGGNSNQEPTSRMNLADLAALNNLEAIWQRSEYPPEDVYKTLQAIVLPEAQTTIHIYSLSPGSMTSNNLGSKLIQWAVQAKSSDDLREALVERSENRTSPLAVTMLLALAVEEGKTEQVQEEIVALNNILQSKPTAETVMSLFDALSFSLKNKNVSEEAITFIESAITILSPTTGETGTWGFVELLLLESARWHFEQFESEKAVKNLEDCLKILNATKAKQPPQNHWHWTEKFYCVALEFLNGGETEKALEVIAEVAKLQPPTAHYPKLKEAQVAAALYKRLMSLDSDERYRILHDWTLTSDGSSELNTFSTITTTTAPPPVFARVLGERPTSDSFPIATVNGVHGLFSTSWLLVKTANETGRLRTLRQEVEKRAQAKVPFSDELLQLIQIAEADEKEFPELRLKILADSYGLLELKTQMHREGSEKALLPNLISAAACLSHPLLKSTTPELFKNLVQFRDRAGSSSSQALLRHAHAIAISNTSGIDAQSLLGKSDLKNWVPTYLTESQKEFGGSNQSLWLEHDDYLMHLAGPQQSYLCYQFPLQGEFEVSLKTLQGNEMRGNLSYNGLLYEFDEKQNLAKIWNYDRQANVTKLYPFVRSLPWATYQNVKLRVTPQKTEFEFNGRPVATDLLQSTNSPWLALQTSGDRKAFFRQIEIHGTPIVPDEIALSTGNDLRGWSTNFFQSQESLPVKLTAPSTNSTETTESLWTSESLWTNRDGVLLGNRIQNSFEQTTQSRLTYFRPLLNDESISYEFYYSPRQFEVHPAIGRLAFQLHEEGVQVHWMSLSDQDWTGLKTDNATIEPLNRRGDRTLPLKNESWNTVTCSIENSTLKLTLNSVLIYERKLEETLDRHFSFYHDSNRTRAKIRSVKMQGNWSQQFAKVNLPHLIPKSKLNDNKAIQTAKARIFDEQHLSDTTLEVHQTAMQLSPQERYQYLVRWVIPDQSFLPLRVQIDFTPTHPIPGTSVIAPLDVKRIQNAEERGLRKIQTGGQLISPAKDLVDVAAELGKLNDLRKKLQQNTVISNYGERARLCFMTLIEIADGNTEAANDAIFKLQDLVQKSTHTTFQSRHPETLATHVASFNSETQEAGREFAYSLYLKQARSGPESGHPAWKHHIDVLNGITTVNSNGGAIEGNQVPTTIGQLNQWDSSSRWESLSRGNGVPPAHWWFDQERVHHLSNHSQDLLYFQSPLRGSFSIEADFPSFGYRETGFYYGGRWIIPRYDLKGYYWGDFRTTGYVQPIRKAFTKFAKTFHTRIEVSDQRATWYINGMEVHNEPLPQNSDPWLAIFNRKTTLGMADNVRITGNPDIPEEIELYVDRNLTSWAPYYEDEILGLQSSPWIMKPIEGSGSTNAIFARKRDELSGSWSESLLRYHRPMCEDGTVEYEFFYEKGKSEVHPALDRCTFILNENGVGIHWLTDGKHDRTGISPDNLTIETENRRGPEELPLKNGEWNRISMVVEGDVIRLSLNDQLIYERTIEIDNQRTIGFFHYADQTESYIRNMTWKGDWEKRLPSLEDQELNSGYGDFLDKDFPKLTDVFEHDFTKEGLPAGIFKTPNPEHFELTERGVRLHRRGTKGYYDINIKPKFLSLKGDYDITVEFESYSASISSRNGSAFMLSATTAGETIKEARVFRRTYNLQNGTPDEVFQNATIEFQGDKRFNNYSRSEAFEANSGSLRLARRGKTVYFLIAEGNSKNFRVIRSVELGNEPVSQNGIRIFGQTHEVASIDVTVKSLKIRAEELVGMDLESQSQQIAKLNRERSELGASYSYDYSKTGVNSMDIYSWSFDPTTVPTPDGLLVKVNGNKNWHSVGTGLRKRIRGDFDVSFTFGEVNMEAANEGENSTIYLHAQLSNEPIIQARIISSVNSNGYHEAKAQVKIVQKGQEDSYVTLGRVPIQQMSQARIARRGDLLYILYSEQQDSPEQLIGKFKADESEVRSNGIRMYLHNGSIGKTTEALFKTIEVKADEIEDLPVQIITPPQVPTQPAPVKPNYLLEALQDLFR